jgi:hypothetical protein
MSIRDSVLSSSTKAPNYGLLLIVLSMLIVFAPIATRAGSAYGVEALFNLVLVAGVFSTAWRRGQQWPFVSLTLLTIVLRWSALLRGGFGLELASAAATVLWIAASIVIVGRELFRQHEITTNMLLGAIVAYLLAAVGFAYLYEILELFQPGSFSGIPDGASPQELGDALLYFSLVSLTTVGYGDIVPASGLARPLAVFEGVFGTLYLAVMIARLVGLHIAAGLRGEDNGR